MHPLVNELEKGFEVAGKRKYGVLKSTPLHQLFWGMERKQALVLVQDSLRSAVKMAFFNMERVVFVYTDASEAL